MDEDLVQTMHKLYAQKNYIKSLGNSKIIVQIGDNTLQFEELSFRKLRTDENKAEIEYLLELFRKAEHDEYVIAAYHDGKIIGNLTKLV